MQMSEEIKNIAAALAKAQKVFPEIKRDRTVQVRAKSGATYSYKYAELSSVLKSVTPALTENGLSIIQSADCVDHTVEIDTVLIHTSGEYFKSCLHLPVVEDAKNVVQAIGSSVSYGRRYALSCMLGIASEKDDDGDSLGEGGGHPETGAKKDQKPKSLPACPKCKKKASVIESKPEYGGGYHCFKKKAGCGHSWGQVSTNGKDNPARQTPAQWFSMTFDELAKDSPIAGDKPKLREAKLEFAAEVLGLKEPLKSSKDLTDEQFRRIRVVLEKTSIIVPNFLSRWLDANPGLSRETDNEEKQLSMEDAFQRPADNR